MTKCNKFHSAGLMALMISFSALAASAQDVLTQKAIPQDASIQDNAPQENSAQAPQAANTDDILQQFSDYEITSAVLSEPQFYSEPVADGGLLGITQNGTEPAISVDTNTFNFDPRKTDDTPMSYQELQALKNKFRPVDVSQKKSKIERYKPEFSIRTNNDVIEIK